VAQQVGDLAAAQALTKPVDSPPVAKLTRTHVGSQSRTSTRFDDDAIEAVPIKRSPASAPEEGSGSWSTRRAKPDQILKELRRDSDATLAPRLPLEHDHAVERIYM